MAALLVAMEAAAAAMSVGLASRLSMGRGPAPLSEVGGLGLGDRGVFTPPTWLPSPGDRGGECGFPAAAAVVAEALAGAAAWGRTRTRLRNRRCRAPVTWTLQKLLRSRRSMKRATALHTNPVNTTVSKFWNIAVILDGGGGA